MRKRSESLHTETIYPIRPIQNVGHEDDEITVTWGEEKYTPVAYHTFSVGPFTITSKVRPGETREEAFIRAYDDLERQARAVVNQKARDFLETVKLVSAR